MGRKRARDLWRRAHRRRKKRVVIIQVEEVETALGLKSRKMAFSDPGGKEKGKPDSMGEVEV